MFFYLLFLVPPSIASAVFTAAVCAALSYFTMPGEILRGEKAFLA